MRRAWLAGVITGLLCAGLPLSFVLVSALSIGPMLFLPVVLFVAVVARAAYVRGVPTKEPARA